MGHIKFGKAQINKPTPSKINLWVKVFTVTAVSFMTWMATANIMGPNTKDVVNQVLGLALILAQSLSPLFGVDIDSKQEVLAEDVTAMEVPEK